MTSISNPISVLVVLPTYRRPGPLVWSLGSVLRQTFTQPVTSARIVVLNNDSQRDAVQAAVTLAQQETPGSEWKVEVIHRDPPMDPVLSWYGGIRDHAKDGDVVFLHGDDDLLLRGSIDVRTRLLIESEAEMLLTHSYADLTFADAQASRALTSSLDSWNAPSGTEVAEALSLQNAVRWGPAFIGNHAYRTTNRFWAGYNVCLERMRKVPLQGTQQLAMLPYLLPIDVTATGSLVCANTTTGVRGQSLADLQSARFGHTTWQPGVLYAAALSVLNRDELRGRDELNSWRTALSREVTRWLLPTLAFPDTRRALVKVLSLTTGDLRPGHAVELARGALMLARSAAATRGLSRRRKIVRDEYSRQMLFARLFETVSAGS